MIGRLPIRIRLTLPFALAMALVLAATGAFVYVRVSRALVTSVDQVLRSQATEAVAHLARGRPLLDRDAADGATLAQAVARSGAVLSSTHPGLPSPIGRADALRALDGHAVWLTKTVPGLKGEWRLLALPARSGSARVVLVLGAPLAAREDTVHRLRNEFMLAAPAALLLATIAGYALAAAALRPVEAMRRRAARITAAELGRRLPVPPATDEVSRLAETLNDMLGRLEAAFEHERRFVADASHELRTPLALLRAELEIALRRPRPRAELELALRSASEETERLTRLAEDLLLIARSDQGPLPIRRERLSVRSLLRDLAERFAARAAELGRAVMLEPGEDVLIDGDRMRLEQALGNLVDNSLRHGRGDVTLSGKLLDGRVRLCVADRGDGFPPGFVERAFDRFSRPDDARSPSGTGLGLAIVAAIARGHGGEAGVANRPGGGTEAWIVLHAVAGTTGSELRAGRTLVSG